MGGSGGAPSQLAGGVTHDPHWRKANPRERKCKNIGYHATCERTSARHKTPRALSPRIAEHDGAGARETGPTYKPHTKPIARHGKEKERDTYEAMFPLFFKYEKT